MRGPQPVGPPQNVSEPVAPPSADDLFVGDDATTAAHRQRDWSATALGPVEGWSPALRSAVRTVVPSRVPMLLWWGPELVQIYNEAYRLLIGDKHPAAVGQTAAECWAEAWGDLSGLAATARSGVATHSQDLPLVIRRHGFDEETSWTFSYSPVRGDDGSVEGVFVATTDTTQVGVRGARLALLGQLGALHHASTPSAEDLVRRAVATLSTSGGEVRFAVARLCQDDAALRTVATLGLAAPDAEPPGDPDLLRRALDEAAPVREEAPATGWAVAPPAPHRAPTTTAVHLPIVDRGQDRTIGTLTLGLNPHRADDATYRSFLELIARHLSTGVTDALARSADQRQVEALAALDRAKTRFLQNVSHELRTPLALLTGSHHALLHDGTLPETARHDVEVAQRATQRLSRLVDGLLDIARAEDGQVEAHPVPTDLGQLTSDVASMFRSAIEAAGLVLDVRIGTLPAPVEVDPEMWSRIVSNLLSNAFKFTSDGTITVALDRIDGSVALVVTDTGSGIPADELPRLFDRFHQVPSSSARTAEGAGIGLALVRDLVTALGGEVAADSTLGRGSRFTVTIPHRTSTAPAGEVAPALEWAGRFASEVRGWGSGTVDPSAEGADGAEPDDDCILVVEDNADMREHLARLLRSDGWAVDAVADVPSALRRPTAPLLVLSDVMLPGADGIELVQMLRAHPEQSEVPVILLTARAGPEAAAEGLVAGATDYLVKPFEPTELLARVRTHAEHHRRRRQALSALGEAGDRADNLQVALGSNRRIGAAIGIIMERERITEDEAFLRLRKASQDGNRKLRDLADQIVLTGTVPSG